MGVSLVGVVVVVVVVGLAVRLLRRERHPTGDGHGVRRFFQYLLLYGLLWVAASGVTGLLGQLFDLGRTVVQNPSTLALNTAFAVVGVPCYAFLALWTRRDFGEDPYEARSRGWRLYVTAASLTALALAMGGAYQVLAWATRISGFEGSGLAMFAVWGVVWFGHWTLDRRFTAPDDFTLHRLLGSGLGLVVTAVGAGWLLSDVAAALFDLGPEEVFLGTEHPFVPGAVTLAVGLPVWLLYWVLPAARYRRTRVWLGYALLAGVAGGLATAVVSASLAVYDTAVWLLGDPWSTLASDYFQRVPELVGSLIVGVLAWWYHRVVLREGGPVERTEAQRVYEYAVAAVGLVAAAAGVMLVVVAVVEALAGSADVIAGGTSVVNTVIGALTLLVVGAPVWWIFWRRIEATVRVDPQEEHASPTRRVYVRVLFGVSGLAAVVALLVLAVFVLEDVFAGTVSAETLRGVRYAVGVIAATGLLSAYHWGVHRDDREYLLARRHGPRYVLLVGPSDAGIGRALARRTGGRVEVWSRSDGVGEPWSVDDLAAQLAQVHAEDEVVVVAGADGATLVPVERH